MSFQTRREDIQRASKYYPNTTPSVARKLAVRLLKAKAYMRQRGIDAVEVGSKFEYKTGGVK